MQEFESDPSKYHIIFTNADHTEISTVEIVPALDYELRDYSVASRQFFWTQKEANAYGAELAEKHGIKFVQKPTGDPEEGYLD
jgi:hypothetical protein